MFWILFFLLALLALAWARAGLYNSAWLLGGAIVFYGVVSASPIGFVLLALIWAAIFLPLLAPALRQEWLSRPVFAAFRRGVADLPERIEPLLESGTAGWEAELLGGAPDWQALRTLTPPNLTPDEAERLRALEDTDIIRLRTWLADEDPAPSPYLTACARVRRMASGHAVDSVEDQGWLGLLLAHGEPSQRETWLPRSLEHGIAAARLCADADAVVANGRIARSPREGDSPGLRLSLVPGSEADSAAGVYGLLVRLGSERGGRGQGLACVLLPAETEGLHAQPRPEGGVSLSGEALFLPLDLLIGGVTAIGRGGHWLADAMSRARAAGAPARTLGRDLPAALRTARRARAHAPLLAPQTTIGAVRVALARSAAAVYAQDSLLRLGAATLDADGTPTTLAAITATESWRLHQVAVEQLGGIFEDAVPDLHARPRASANAILMLRALGRCHPHLKRQLEAAREENPALALEKFDTAFWGHVGHSLSHGARSIVLTAGGGALLPVQGLAPTLARGLRRLYRSSANLALVTDLALWSRRGALFSDDLLLDALGRALARLQTAAAVLWRAADDGEQAHFPLMRLACGAAYADAQAALADALACLPPLARGVGRLLVFPRGRWRLGMRADDHDRACHWLYDGAAAKHFVDVMPGRATADLEHARRFLSATLAGEGLLASVDQHDAGSDFPDWLRRATADGRLDAGQKRQLEVWLALAGSAGATSPSDDHADDDTAVNS